MLNTVEQDARVLYDGGWRAKDRGELMLQYELGEGEADVLIRELKKLEASEITAQDTDQIAEYGDYITLKKEKYNFYPVWMWDACFETLESDYYGVYVDGYNEQIPHDDYELMIAQQGKYR